MHTETTLLHAIRARSGRQFRQVRFKANRVRLLSISQDGATLYLHISFRAAPREVVEAIAAFLRAGRGSAESARAVARLRRWATESATAALSAGTIPANPTTSPLPRRPPRPGRCCATPAQRQFLATLYREFNRTHCEGRLPPELPLRFSDRMRRRLGHIRYHETPEGERIVVELALNIDLMGEGSESQLRDTLLHEMAHVEAWLTYGDRGHGRHWRRIAERLGCVPRACTHTTMAIRPAGSLPTTRVPPRYLVG
jgi:hypothetical protein